MNLASNKSRSLVRGILDRQRLPAGDSRIPKLSRSGGNVFPAANPQYSFWFFHELDPQSPAYNISKTLRLTGLLDLHLLMQCLRGVVGRHEALRTTFRLDEDKLQQVIAEFEEFQIPLIDLRGLQEVRIDEEVLRLSSVQALRPFDLDKGPLIRFQIAEVRREEYILWITAHHIIFDDLSFSIFLSELADVYNSTIGGNLASDNEPSIQYVDCTEWMKSQNGDTDLKYWLDKLSGELPNIELPVRRPSFHSQGVKGKMTAFRLDAAVTNALKDVSKSEQVSLFATLLSIFHILLSRYIGTADIITGVPVSGRTCSEAKNIIGCFVNLVAIRTEVDPNSTFRQYVRAVHKTVVEAISHQSTPFYSLVKELYPDRRAGRSPIVQVVINLQNSHQVSVELRDINIELVDNSVEMPAKFDLSLIVNQDNEGLSIICEFDPDKYDERTAVGFTDHFKTLTSSVAISPDSLLSVLNILTETERHQVLSEFNDTGRTYPKDKCVHQLFEEQVERTPEAIAVVYEDVGVTYAELNRRSNQLARHLCSDGVGPGVLVGICVERSFDMVVGLLGVMKAGGAYVPIDPYYPDERIAFMLSDAAVAIVLTQEKFLSKVISHSERTVCLDSQPRSLGTGSSGNLIDLVSYDQLAYVIYTSGSTGVPKGAGVSHRGLTNLLHWFTTEFQISSDDRILLVTSLGFDLTQKNILGPLITGGCLYMCAFESYDPGLIAQAVSKSKITMLNCTPSAFYPLVDGNAGIQVDDLKSIRVLILGGEPIDGTRLARWVNSPGFRSEIVNSYGPTECTDVVTYHRLASRDLAGETCIPLGRPIQNAQAFVMDKHLQPTPIGVAGELCVAGDCVGTGYINRPDLTSERFIDNPYGVGPTSLLYRTGDLVRWQYDGNLEFLGRIDNQVKIRGFRVELGEIESALRDTTGVRDAVVSTYEDISDNKCLVAYVVRNQPDEDTIGEPLNVELIRDQLLRQLPLYLVPSHIFEISAIPLAPNGKVDRSMLPAVADRQDRKLDNSDQLSELEALLTEICADALSVGHVGLQDNFFNLGGHSILALRFVFEVQRLFPFEERLITIFFRQPTVQMLVSVIRERSEGVDVEEIAKAVRQVRALSDEEVESIVSSSK